MQLQRRVIDSSCLLRCHCIHMSDLHMLVLYVDCVAVKFKITEGLICLEIGKDQEKRMLKSKL